MKKILFFLFAICVYGPSFGACNLIYGPVPSGNQYLESQFSFTGKPAYLRCGNSTTNNAQCAQNDIVAGKDGYLYKCNNDAWIQMRDDNIQDCQGTRYKKVGLNPTFMPRNTNSKYIYLVQYRSGSEATSYQCKFQKKEEDAVKKLCILSCGEYYSGICNRDHAKDIIVEIVDKDNKAINSVSIKYLNLTAPNNTINIATQKEEGDYAICLNNANKDLNVQISAPDYTSVTKTVEQLLDKNNQTITLQKIKSNNSNQPTQSLPGAATDKNFVMDTSNTLIITCEDKADINCKLPVGHNLAPLRDCKKLKEDLITETNVLYIDKGTFDKCSNQIGNFVDKSNCPAIQRAHVGPSTYVLFCITNPNIKIEYTDEPTDKWSYAHKQCVGSWGIWENDECKCDHLDGAEKVDNECLCLGHNPNQKYYSKLWAGCEHLEEGVKKAGTETILFSQYNLSSIDRANSCSPSGGTWTGREKNECTCSSTLNMEPDSNGYFCNCKEGYDYRDPMAKTDGCILKTQINYDSEEVAAEVPQVSEQNAEQVAPTGTKEYECTKSGGDKYGNGKCICNADKYLEEYEPKNAPEYSICRCMYGYKRKGGTLGEDGRTITEYPDGAECEYAGTETVEKVFDSAQWRKDTEDAYRNEYDNAQSWANKGVTAASTLMTGEGAMMAARAIAEQKADKKAEEQMAEWISKMGCEYGNGQQVNLGKEETLPVGDLAKYYAEYKQLADKLKETKTALNLRPGIESEVLYDRAETGLYQYANAERQSGGFTSLSRALMNPEGADAEQWNAQKAEVAKDLTTGTLLTAGGLVVGAAGNYLVNRNHKKEYQELEKKTKLQQSLDEAVEEILPTVELPSIQIVDEHSTVLDTSALTKPELTLNTDISIPKYPITGESFATDSDVITDTNQLDNYIARINSIMKYNHMPYMQTIHFNIVGHTDRTGSATYNNQLSKRRAESVKNYLKEKLDVPSKYFTVTYYTEGKGFSECPQEGKKNKSECRRVYITVEDKTERNSQN